jgi:methionyl aminopeptidase
MVSASSGGDRVTRGRGSVSLISVKNFVVFNHGRIICGYSISSELLILSRFTTGLGSAQDKMAAQLPDALSKLKGWSSPPCLARSYLTSASVKDPEAVMASAEAAKANGNGSKVEAEDSDDEEDEKPNGEGGTEGAAKKKRKRKRKPKSKTAGANPTKQTSPPRVLLSSLWPNHDYPVGEEVEYRDENLFRTTSEEKRALDRSNSKFLEEYRYGAEVHRQVRQWAAKNIKPGQSLTEIAEGIEDSVRALTGHPGLVEGDNILGGVAFPTGLNLDHIAAHYSPNAGNKILLAQDNVMKVDFGVHINGRIVDSAFTMAFDPMYDNLLTAVREGTNTGIREAGIDARLGEIGEKIQETMESYEVEIRGETFPVKCIRNLNGHDIRQHQIHGGKSVPIVKSNDQTKMEEGEVFAIETFGSTGNGYVRDDVSSLIQIQGLVY